MNTRRGSISVPTVDVVLPCLDEAPALPGVVAAIPPEYGVVVADNGSGDGTPEVGRELGARVVIEARRGYGAAVHAGVAAATAEIVAVMDADGSLDAAELPALVSAVRSGEVDLAAGRRRPGASGAWPWHARAGNVVLAGLLRRRGVNVHDIAPIRVMRRIELEGLGLTDMRFGYPLELLIRAGRAGMRIQEFDVAYRARVAGTKSKVSGSIRGTVRAIKDMGVVLERVGR